VNLSEARIFVAASLPPGQKPTFDFAKSVPSVAKNPYSTSGDQPSASISGFSVSAFAA
jgi:hypothetical protein